jgi:hypothetical protein
LADNPQDTDTRELTDLQELLRSDGFTRFRAHVEDEWGAVASIQRIDRALTELPPGDRDAERETVLQIRAAARQIHALLQWPEERIAQLKGPKKKTISPMEALRRIAR